MNLSIANSSTAEATLDVAFNNLKLSATVILSSISLFLNGVLLLTFCLYQNFWTPFDTYFIGLCIANVIFHGILGPLNTLELLQPSLWIGVSGCTVYVYGIAVMTVIQALIHGCIALNRICALWMPITFYHFHSFRAACMANCLIWLLAHLISLPAILMDVVLYGRRYKIDECFRDTISDQFHMNAVSLTINETVVIMCFCVILISLPLVLWRQGARSSWKKNLTIRPEVPGQSRTESKATRNTTSSTNRQSLVLMAALTVSILVCWGPTIVYLAYAVASGRKVPVLNEALEALFNCQSIADPILLLLALPAWKRRLKELFSQC